MRLQGEGVGGKGRGEARQGQLSVPAHPSNLPHPRHTILPTRVTLDPPSNPLTRVSLPDASQVGRKLSGHPHLLVLGGSLHHMGGGSKWGRRGPRWAPAAACTTWGEGAGS